MTKEYDPDRAARRRDRWQMVMRIAAALVLALVVGFTLDSNAKVRDISQQRLNNSADIKEQNRDIKDALDKLNRLVSFTDAASSPASRQAQQAQLQALVNQIGCDNREVIQEVITGLETAGLLDPGAIVVTCPVGPG